MCPSRWSSEIVNKLFLRSMKVASICSRLRQNFPLFCVCVFCSQPYRTTPLILPGAKNNLQKHISTESYLRHHPNPQMRGPPTHDFTDIQMKQKVADTVLHVNIFPVDTINVVIDEKCSFVLARCWRQSCPKWSKGWQKVHFCILTNSFLSIIPIMTHSLAHYTLHKTTRVIHIWDYLA